MFVSASSDALVFLWSNKTQMYGQKGWMIWCSMHGPLRLIRQCPRCNEAEAKVSAAWKFLRLLLPTSAVGNNKQAADVGLLQDHADVVIALVLLMLEIITPVWSCGLAWIVIIVSRN